MADRDPFDREPIWHNTDAARNAARLAGVSFVEFMEAAQTLGLRTLNGRFERHEIRQVLSKLIVRTKPGD